MELKRDLGGRGGSAITTARISLVMAALALAGCSSSPDSSPPGPSPSPPSAEALVVAAHAGDLPAVRRALDAGVPIDATGPGRESALLAAVNGDRTAVGLYLLERGASVNVQADNLDTPWLQAGALGRTELIPAMAARRPDFTIRNRYGGNALIPACERAHVETVRELLRTPIDIDHVNNLGWTCLLEAVILGSGGPAHQDVIRLVLAAGANPNIGDRDGVTPLQHARRRGQSDVAAILTAAGAR